MFTALWPESSAITPASIDVAKGVHGGRGCFAVCVIGQAPENKPRGTYDRDPVNGRRAPVHELHQLEPLTILPRVKVIVMIPFVGPFPHEK
jgi:hypothetical protein